MRRSALILIGIAALLLPGVRSASAEGPVLDEHYETMFADMQAELRPRLIVNLDPGNTRRFEDINVQVLRSPELLARAGYVDGKPTIQLSTALLQVIDQLGATSIHSNTLQVALAILNFRCICVAALMPASARFRISTPLQP